MTWFWLNVPFMLLFLGCWAGIPAWHTLKRWDVELKAKHAELAAGTAPQAALAQPVPAMAAAPETGRPAYAATAAQGR